MSPLSSLPLPNFIFVCLFSPLHTVTVACLCLDVGPSAEHGNLLGPTSSKNKNKKNKKQLSPQQSSIILQLQEGLHNHLILLRWNFVSSWSCEDLICAMTSRWAHMHNSSAVPGKDCVTVVNHCLWLLHSLHFLFCDDVWTLGRQVWHRCPC